MEAIASYHDELLDDPGFDQAADALASAAPDSVIGAMLSDGAFSLLAAPTATSSWFTSMPTSAQSFWSSAAEAEISIVSKITDGEE